jgi:hypothetical protein
MGEDDNNNDFDNTTIPTIPSEVIATGQQGLVEVST